MNTLADLLADPMYVQTKRLGIQGLGALFEADRIARGGVSSVGAELPACEGFTGSGSRCTSCRILKKIHA